MLEGEARVAEASVVGVVSEVDRVSPAVAEQQLQEEVGKHWTKNQYICRWKRHLDLQQLQHVPALAELCGQRGKVASVPDHAAEAERRRRAVVLLAWRRRTIGAAFQTSRLCLMCSDA